MSQGSLIDANRRLLLRNGAAIVLSGAAVALRADRQSLAQSASKGDSALSQTNLNETAPTRFQNVGDTRLAYRRFGKEGAPPVVCLQHFTGTMNTGIPSTPTGSLMTVLWCLWTIEAWADRRESRRTRWAAWRPTSLRSSVRSGLRRWIFSDSRSAAWSHSKSHWMRPIW